MHSRDRSVSRGTTNRKAIPTIARVATVWNDWRLILGPESKRVAPVCEICKSLVHDKNTEPTPGREIFDLIQDFAGLSIQEHLKRKELVSIHSEVAKEAVAHALAGLLVALLRWWVENDMNETPAEIDDLFHNMVWHGLNKELRTKNLCP